MIDRIWYGPEKEGFEKGKITAFIEAEAITDTDLDFLCEILKGNGLYRLYFGANERDLKSVPDNFMKRLSDFAVFIETSLDNLLETIKIAKRAERVILRQWIELPTEYLLSIQFKFRNRDDIILLKDWAHTGTGEIKDGIYEGDDTILYQRQ